MKILFLGYPDSPLIDFLKEDGNDVKVETAKITLEEIDSDFIVSYGYRHIISKDIVEAFDGRAINLHISYLPWNRGASPTLWSIRENTPKGVTIHYIDKGIDTGDIISQELGESPEVISTEDLVKIHHNRIQALFKTTWPSIKAQTCNRLKQVGSGSYHSTANSRDIFKL